MNKVRIVLLAIVVMLAWICLWVWVAVVDWSSSSRWLARGRMTATWLGYAAHNRLHQLWHPEYIVRGLAAILVVLAVIFSERGMNAADGTFMKTFAPNLATDCLSLAVTILVIDQLYRWRDKVYQQRIDESLAAERKRNIIQQMASQSNDFALDALRIARNEGWLIDGSFRGAELEGANLQRADLEGADLQDATLWGANLRGAHLQGAHLLGAKLEGAKYDSETIWPAGFDPITAGAILDEGLDEY